MAVEAVAVEADNVSLRTDVLFLFDCKLCDGRNLLRLCSDHVSIHREMVIFLNF